MGRFHFKCFSIQDDNSAMKIGTDAVILGAYAGADVSPHQILDIGTGTGIVALMMAQRFGDALISAVEIDLDACSDAKENTALSPWSKRITIHHSDFLKWKTQNTFDLIVSNPPFFSETLVSSNLQRAQARSNISLSYTQLITKAQSLLSCRGAFQVIIPYDSEPEFVFVSGKHNLFLHDKLHLRDKPGKEIKRSVLKFTQNPPKVVSKSELIIRNSDGSYSKEFKSFTKAFYLNF